jgi:hypothetical protein
MPGDELMAALASAGFVFPSGTPKHQRNPNLPEFRRLLRTQNPIATDRQFWYQPRPQYAHFLQFAARGAAAAVRLRRLTAFDPREVSV